MVYYKLIENKRLSLYISTRIGDLVYDPLGNIYRVSYKEGKIVFKFILPSVLVKRQLVEDLTDKQYKLFFNISKNGVTTNRKKK